MAGTIAGQGSDGHLLLPLQSPASQELCLLAEAATTA